MMPVLCMSHQWYFLLFKTKKVKARLVQMEDVSTKDVILGSEGIDSIGKNKISVSIVIWHWILMKGHFQIQWNLLKIYTFEDHDWHNIFSYFIF